MKNQRKAVDEVPALWIQEVELAHRIAAGSGVNSPVSPITNNWNPEHGGTQNQEL